MYRTALQIACTFLIAISAIISTASSAAPQNVTESAGVDSGYVTVNGVKLHYREAGAAADTTLILVHGWPLSSRLFSENISTLGEACHVIAIDLRGFGESESGGSQSEVRVETYADDVLAMMDQMNIDKAVIGGMSMGGPIIFAMYQKAPERFSGMLLMDTVAAAATPPEKHLWIGWTQYIEKKGVGVIPKGAMDEMLTIGARMDRPELVNTVKSIMMDASKEGAIAGANALASRPDFRPLLDKIDVPTLIIVGNQDTIYPPSIARQMHKSITGSEIAALDNASHAAILEGADAANEAILKWMRGIR